VKNHSITLNRFLWLRWIFLLSLICVIFVYGIGVGRYKWPPHNFISYLNKTLQDWLPEQVVEYRGEAELLTYAFTRPVVEFDLYYSPITDLAGIRDANNRIFVLREGFETSFENLILLGAEQLTRPKGALPVLRVRFRYQERIHEAFAYGLLRGVCDQSKSAGLIIPGSGINQSASIAAEDTNNNGYGIVQAVNEWGGMAFVLIKPGEDFLAWHDGKGSKLNRDFILNWHLNREGAYSASYLVQSLAITKWMKGCYGKTLVAGLSQGGSAALINALQSEPNYAIVASGFSVINAEAEWSGHDQIIGVPGYGELFNPEHLAGKLKNSPTQWLFSWGKNEVGTYKIEAEEQLTAKIIREHSNVIVSIHNGGHSFPKEAIKNFLITRALSSK
jgi:hypothetical protein